MKSRRFDGFCSTDKTGGNLISCFRTFIALALFLGATSAFAQVGEISDKRDAPKDSLVATQSFAGATNTPSDAPTLLDVVKTEAAQMDVFPKRSFYIA